MGDSHEDLDEHESKLFGLIPEDGSAIGNRNLRRQLGWDGGPYFAVRNRLVDRALIAIGRGFGGSVYRIVAGKTTAEPKKPFLKDLYDPMADALREYWSKVLRHPNYAVEVTAAQGRKDTGGMWTRPDITVVAVSTYAYVPGRFMDVMTYEIKPEGGWSVDGVFEAASHSRFATHSYLVIHTPGGAESIGNESLERLEKECVRFGVGLVLVDDPGSYDTFDFRIDPVRRQPDPEETNRFIDQQLSRESKNRILSWK